MSAKYERIDINITCRILKFLKSGPKRILKIHQHCNINSTTCDNHLDFLVNMGWVLDIKQHRHRTVKITEEGRKYQEKFCNGYRFENKDGIDI